MRRIRCCLRPYCTSASDEKYFRIPRVKDGTISQVTKNLNRKRRLRWLKVLDLTEAALEKELILVCSRHFVSGRPADEMYENDVDWAPSLHLPIPKRIFIPPPTDEHSYCQVAIKNSGALKEQISDCSRLPHGAPKSLRRCSRRLPIVKKKKEKAMQRAAKAQQLADAHKKKIQDKRRKKKKLEIKKAKKLEKLQEAEIHAASLIEADKNIVNLVQVPNIDLRSPNDKFHTLHEPKSAAIEKPNTLGNNSITSIPNEANVFKAPVIAISTVGSSQKFGLTKALPQQRAASSISKVDAKNLGSQAALVPVAPTKIVGVTTKPVSKNQSLQHLAPGKLAPISNLTYVRQALPPRIAKKIAKNNVPQRIADQLKMKPFANKVGVVNNDDNAPPKTSQSTLIKDLSQTSPENISHESKLGILKPSPQNEKFMQNMHSVQDHILDLMLKKNPTHHDTTLSFQLLNLIEHRQNILGTEPPALTVPLFSPERNSASPNRTNHSCEYILPDATVPDKCSSCSRPSFSADVIFLKSQLKHKSNLLVSCSNQLDTVRKELAEAKKYIRNLSAQLQENTLTLCSYLAANPLETLKKEK